MHTIEAVRSEAARADAQALFLEYGEFLLATQSCGYFVYADFEVEVATLPATYAEHGGEVLLAYAEGAAVACIAFRQSLQEGPESCEIKRLFVKPGMRGLGLARELVAAALKEAKARGYRRAVLDTDTAHMPGAAELYGSFGFAEYGVRRGAIAFYEFMLTH